MKIWHISDTHTYHELLVVPEGIDMVIFSGDCSTSKELHINEAETWRFIDWYKDLPIKYKIFVAGNHDFSIEKNLITKQDFNDHEIIYLENGYTIIEDLKIWGSPITPVFNMGSFIKRRNEMDSLWSLLPDDIDILITHGPPKGVLDLSVNRAGILEYCGCEALKSYILNRIKPKYHFFGHIHNYLDIINAGTMTLSGYDTIFSNGTVVCDRKFGKLISNGNIFKL